MVCCELLVHFFVHFPIGWWFFFFFNSYLFICCHAPAFSSCGEQGLLSSCCAGDSHWSGFSYCRARALVYRLHSCGTQAELLCGMGDLSGPGTKPMSLALARDCQTLDHQEVPTGWFCLFFF